jgi:hypothetical protein
MRWPFACQATVLGSGNLGGHDGVGFWSVHTGHVGTHDRQHRVSIHERLHHELVMSTPWGLLTSVLGSLAVSDRGTIEHENLFLRAAAWSCDVHETYATYFSIGPERDLLTEDGLGEVYLAYYRQADGFCPDPHAPWPTRAAFAYAALVVAMAPSALSELLSLPLDSWRTADVNLLEQHRPDLRWRRAWVHRERLWDQFTRLGLDHCQSLDDERVVYAYEQAADALGAIGVTSMTRALYRELVEQLMPQLSEYLGGGPPYELVEQSAESTRSDFEEHQRERLQFRDRPLRALPVGDDLAQRWTDFAAYHPSLGLHTVLFWLRSDLLDRQIDSSPRRSSAVLALMSIAEGISRTGEVLLWTMNGALGPDPIAAAFADRNQRLIVATTLATVADAPETATSAHVPRLYVLIDLPVLPILESWLSARATIRWHSAWIDGPHPLYAFTFDVSVNPGMVLLHITSSAGRSALLNWLSSLEPSAFIRDHRWGMTVCDHVNSLVQHLIATWWFHDQRAGHQPQPQ